MFRLVRLCVAVAAALLASASLAVAAPALEVYGRLPAIDMVELSPSGQRLAYVAAVGGADRSLVIQGLDGKALATAPVGAAKVRNLEWVGDDHVLVFVTQTAAILPGAPKQEFLEVLQVDAAKHDAWAVFGKSTTVLKAVFGYAGSAKVDGRLYGYFGGVTLGRGRLGGYLQHGYPDLYRVDLETGEMQIAAHGNQNEHRWLVDGAGEIVAHSEYVEATGDWRLYRGASGPQVLAQHASMGGGGLQGLGRTPGTVLIGDAEDETVRELPLAGGEATPLFEDKPVDGFLRDHASHLLLGARLNGEPGAELFDPDLQRRFDAAHRAFDKAHVEMVSFASDLQHMVVFTEGAGDAGTYWLVDIAGKRVAPIGERYPDVKAADVGPPSLFAYKAADGLAMDGVLTLPPGREAKALPLVVLPHGGPIVPGDKPGFDWWAQAFASRGYAVFQPNYRGTLGYGLAFRKAAFGQWGRKMQTDISDGVAALAAKGIVDPKRACIVGASYGGYAALAGVTLQQGLYRCSVSVAGVGDMRRMIAWVRGQSQSENDASRLWRVMTDDPTGESGQAAISPAANAARADAPILLIHGKDDTVVPIEQSEAMAAALKRAGKPVAFVVMDGEDHWLSRQATRQAMLKAAVAFVEKHNPAS